MNFADKLCVAGFLIGLVVLGLAMFRGAYQRANPKRRPPYTTDWQDGRRG